MDAAAQGHWPRGWQDNVAAPPDRRVKEEEGAVESLRDSGCPAQVETTPGRALCPAMGDLTALRELHTEAPEDENSW